MTYRYCPHRDALRIIRPSPLLLQNTAQIAANARGEPIDLVDEDGSVLAHANPPGWPPLPPPRPRPWPRKRPR